MPSKTTRVWRGPEVLARMHQAGEAFVVRASELEIVIAKTLEDVNVAKGRIDSITTRINDMKKNNIPEEEILKLGPEFEQATNAYEQAIANHAFVNGQYIDCKSWATKIDKAMEYSGKSGQILALRGEKWHRFENKQELTGGYQSQEIQIVNEIPKQP